jgi:hypothetical protein
MVLDQIYHNIIDRGGELFGENMAILGKLIGRSIAHGIGKKIVIEITRKGAPLCAHHARSIIGQNPPNINDIGKIIITYDIESYPIDYILKPAIHHREKFNFPHI